jgi:hypothetical protein
MRFRIAFASMLVLGGLAGCAGDRPRAAVDPTWAASPADSGPISLVGLWTVAGTDEQAGTVLRIAPKKQLSLWRACGALTGSWAGAQDVFLADLHGGSGNCGEIVTPAWLKQATGYRSLGDEKVLVDRNEKELARLVPGGRPKVGTDIDPAEAAPPVLTDEDRAELTGATDGRKSADRALLLGRWVPVANGGPAYVEFKDDNTWTGSDGCNGNGGRWFATSGSMVATTGPSTLIACDGAPIPVWLSSTRMAGFENEVLVLLDVKGAEVGRLKKG